ncbi:MAG TPA: nucleoside deaminase [Tissierellia bacterium]|nr:nucleoside deaminase [Tissierellia bacterium]
MVDERWMRLALEEAKKAFLKDEVPIGAIAIVGDEVIARAHNLKETNHDATHHAELLLLQECARILGRWRLTDVTIYATIEPCIMCMGAMSHARIKRLVYGARDEKFGGAHSLYQIAHDERLNHRFEVEEGILADEASQIMKDFFKRKR